VHQTNLIELNATLDGCATPTGRSPTPARRFWWRLPARGASRRCMTGPVLTSTTMRSGPSRRSGVDGPGSSC